MVSLGLWKWRGECEGETRRLKGGIAVEFYLPRGVYRVDRWIIVFYLENSDLFPFCVSDCVRHTYLLR